MNFIHLKTKDHLITLRSDKVSQNIFIDLTDKPEEKMQAIEAVMKKKKKLDTAAIGQLQQKQILTW